MREIKFRGRSTHTDDWCYGSFVYNIDEPYICGFNIWEQGRKNEWSEEKVELHTIGQFTGLHDVNGKEIYEGDIVIFVFQEYEGKGKNKKLSEYKPVINGKPHVIDFREGAFGYVNFEATEYIEEEWLPLLERECKVIGNVHGRQTPFCGAIQDRPIHRQTSE